MPYCNSRSNHCRCTFKRGRTSSAFITDLASSGSWQCLHAIAHCLVLHLLFSAAGLTCKCCLSAAGHVWHCQCVIGKALMGSQSSCEGSLSIERLLDRFHPSTGDSLDVKVLREGQLLNLKFQLKQRRPLVPILHGVDCVPSYFIVGGLVFVPLSVPFLEHAYGGKHHCFCSATLSLLWHPCFASLQTAVQCVKQ